MRGARGIRSFPRAAGGPRLLQGNVRNDVQALDEAAKILGDLRAAWLQIAPGGPKAADAAAPRRPVETTVSPARRAISAYQA